MRQATHMTASRSDCGARYRASIARRVRTAAVLAIVAAALLPAAGRAGVIAAVGVDDPPTDSNLRSDFNVHVVDPLDPTRSFPLPSGAVTPQAEEAPQFSADANRLLLARAGTLLDDPYSVLEVGLSAGTVAPVALPASATPFEGAYGLSPDGHTIITTRLQLNDTTAGPPTSATATVFDSSLMPAGPLPQVAVPQVSLSLPPNFTFSRIEPQGPPDVSNDRRFVWAVATAVEGGPDRTGFDLITGTVGGQTRATPLPFTGGVFTPSVTTQAFDPVLTPSHPDTITYDDGGHLEQAVIGATATFKLLQLPNVSFPATDAETLPRWTPSGRYLVWVERPFEGTLGQAVDTKIFVYDTQTQQLVRPNGRSVGTHAYLLGLAVAETAPTVTSFAVLPTKVTPPSVNLPPNLGFELATTLRTTTTVGILVERVAGTTKLLGRTVPHLLVVGRVPLGRHHKGASRIPWNGTVAGHRLPKGTYKITMRSIAADGQPSDLSRPVTLRMP